MQTFRVVSTTREHKFPYAAGICGTGRCVQRFRVVSTRRHVGADEVTLEHKFPYAAGICRTGMCAIVPSRVNNKARGFDSCMVT